MKNLIHSDSYLFDYVFITNPLQNSLLYCFIFLYNIHGKSFRFSCWYDIFFIINLCNSEKILQKLAKKNEFSLYDGNKPKYRHNYRPATLVSFLVLTLFIFTFAVYSGRAPPELFEEISYVCRVCVFSVNSTKLKSRGQKKNILIWFSVAALELQDHSWYKSESESESESDFNGRHV